MRSSDIDFREPELEEVIEYTPLNEFKRLYCVIDIETTGPNPSVHEIVSIKCIVADATLKPITGMTPFFMYVRPKKLDNLELIESGTKSFYDFQNSLTKKELRRIVENGYDSVDVIAAFHSWVNRVLGYSSDASDDRHGADMRFIPLTINWGFTSAFLNEFFGWLDPMTPLLSLYFDLGSVRDIATLVPFLNEIFSFEKELDLRCRKRSAKMEFKLSPILAALKMTKKGFTRIDLFKLLELGDIQKASFSDDSPYNRCFLILQVYRLLVSRTDFFSDITDV